MEDLKELEKDMQSHEEEIFKSPFGRQVPDEDGLKEEIIESKGYSANFDTLNDGLEIPDDNIK